MSDKTSNFPAPGENPGLDEEAIKTLRSSRSTLPAGEVQVLDEAQQVGEIRDLTEQLLEKNLEGVEIHETADDTHVHPPSSMVPERLNTTNRPPKPDDFMDIHKALKPTNEKETVPQTIFCVEQEKE